MPKNINKTTKTSYFSTYCQNVTQTMKPKPNQALFHRT